jgi:hypothetical protein
MKGLAINVLAEVEASAGRANNAMKIRNIIAQARDALTENTLLNYQIIGFVLIKLF